jgi:hypothetical protein
MGQAHTNDFEPFLATTNVHLTNLFLFILMLELPPYSIESPYIDLTA